MPELPEVETVRRTLASDLAGARIRSAEVRSEAVIAHPTVQQFVERVTGRRAIGFGRRGKYLLLQLDQLVLVVHLRMTGRLVLAGPEQPEFPHTHVVFTLEDGRLLRFSDTRRFGRLYLYERRDLPRELLAAAGLPADSGAAASAGVPEHGLFKLGPEPDAGAFSAAYLQQRLQGRTAPIKALLLDQTLVAGLGNIYVDEALFRARINPRTPAGAVTPGVFERLVPAVREVLAEAIAAGGTTFSDYVDGRGVPGDMRGRLRVYGRAGEPCRACGQPIVKDRVAGRGTYYCPKCQADG